MCTSSPHVFVRQTGLGLRLVPALTPCCLGSCSSALFRTGGVGWVAGAAAHWKWKANYSDGHGWAAFCSFLEQLSGGQTCQRPKRNPRGAFLLLARNNDTPSVEAKSS